MFVHRVRRLTADEELDFAGCTCNFCPPEQVPFLARFRVLGTEGGHRVGNIACARCAAPMLQEVRQRPATPVTHSEPDQTYDGRPDYILPGLDFPEDDMTPEKAIADLDALLGQINTIVNALGEQGHEIVQQWEALGRMGGQRADHAAALLGRLRQPLRDLGNFCRVSDCQIGQMLADPFQRKED